MEVDMTTALLVIDMQNAILAEAYKADRVLTTVADVIDAARQAGTPIIYMRHEHREDGPMKYGTPAWEIHPAIAPQAGDVVLDKRWPDSFYRTALGDELSARGVTHLVVTGMATEQCVDMTSRGAWSRGYNVTVVADGHTTVDYPGVPPAAERIDYHNVLFAHIENPEQKITVVPAAELRF
jgi:nicotinamidase-related amidase